MSTTIEKPPTRDIGSDPEICPKDQTEMVAESKLKDLKTREELGRLGDLACDRLSKWEEYCVSCNRTTPSGEPCPFKAQLSIVVGAADASETIIATVEDETCLRENSRIDGQL